MRRLTIALLVALLAAWAAPLVTQAARGGDADKLYREVRASQIKVSPSQFVGKDIAIRDYFERLMDKKDRYDRKALRKGWAKKEKIKFDQYVIFYTDRYDNLGSGMRCYLRRSDKTKDMVDMVTTQLKKDDPILLKGKVMEFELGKNAGDPDVTHFMVDEISLGHKEHVKAKKIVVTMGKQRVEIDRARKFDFRCPVCKKHIFYIRWHELDAHFDLEIKCPHCESKITYHFTTE